VSVGAQELLEAWETALGGSPTHRALVLLRSTWDGTDDLAGLPLGVRDLRLLQVRSVLFGDLVDGTCTCPRCGQRLDVPLDLRDVVAAASEPPSRAEVPLSGGRTATVRAVTSTDLLAAAAEGDPVVARRLLAARAAHLAHDDLTDHDVAAIGAAAAALDPDAFIEVALCCPGCEHAWSASLDPAACLWTEVDAWAHRTLRDVDELARAYGWTESEVLALSPRRRQSYLELVRG
jgi:hypothetical protein